MKNLFKLIKDDNNRLIDLVGIEEYTNSKYMGYLAAIISALPIILILINQFVMLMFLPFIAVLNCAIGFILDILIYNLSRYKYMEKCANTKIKKGISFYINLLIALLFTIIVVTFVITIIVPKFML